MPSAEEPDEPPRVSVICPVYNGARFLAEALHSVLDQDFRDFELIVVDDGSTDESPAIAREFAEQHANVRVVQHPGGVNRGLPASRNLGIERSASELLAFIDGDDVWRPGKLAEQVAILDASPEVGMVCGTVRYWSSWQDGTAADHMVPTGPPGGGVLSPPETTFALYPFGTASAPCPSDVMVRRTLATAVGGFEDSFTGDLILYEDQAFFAKVYLHSPVCFSRAYWLDYRRHERSAMATIIGGGQYKAVRRHFMLWLRDYVAERAIPGKARIFRAIRRNLLIYRLPGLPRGLSLWRRVRAKGRALLRSETTL